MRSPDFGAPQPERRKQKATPFEQLEKAVYTVDELKSLINNNPKFKILLEKGIMVAFSNDPTNYRKIKSEQGQNVDVLAYLDRLVKDNGIEILWTSFPDTVISGRAIHSGLSYINFEMISANRSADQLTGAVLGNNWFEEIDDILIKKLLV